MGRQAKDEALTAGPWGRVKMQENRFFRFVWRVNGLAILLLVVCIAAIGGYEIIEPLFSKKPPIIKNVAADPSNKEGWHLGDVNEIIGSQYLFIPLVSENKNVEAPKVAFSPAALRSSEWQGYYRPSRNILFIDSGTMEMKWLFEGNSQLITSLNVLRTRLHGPESNARAIIYEVIKNDTNHNNRLDEGDLANIAISDTGGSGYKELVSSADRLVGARLAGENTAVIFYQVHGIGYAMSIRLDTHASSKPVEMPKVPNPS